MCSVQVMCLHQVLNLGVTKNFNQMSIMKKVLMLISAAAVMFAAASCVKETPVTPEPETTYTAVITAKADGAETKSVLNFNEKKSYWSGEENLSVLGANGNGFRFSANLDEAVAEAKFAYAGDSEFAETEVLAVYPEAIYEWDLATKTVNNVVIPATQYPTLENHAPGAVPAIAYAENVAGGLSFKNIPALIMFTTQEANCYNISFSGNNNEIVAGAFDVTYGQTLSLKASEGNTATSVSLGDLTMEKGKPYFLAVAPQHYAEGFTIKMNGTVVYEYENDKTLASNVIYNVGELNIPESEEWFLCGSMTDGWESQLEMTVGNDGWYTASDVTIYTEDEFKFKQGEPGVWPKDFGSADYGATYAKDVPFDVINSNSQNIKVAENGIYDVKFNPTTAKAILVYKSAITTPIRIYADNQMGWSKVNVHLWVENGDDDVDITSWPGAEMTYDSTSGLYYYDVDVQYHGKEIGYIFNDGINQTDGKSITLLKDGFTTTLKAVDPEPEPEGTVIYFNPGGSSLWDQADAWFEAWVWGAGDKWVTFTATSESGIYSAVVPTGTTGMKILRRGPSHQSGSWDDKWNNTGDITLNGKNYITITGWGDSDWVLSTK